MYITIFPVTTGNLSWAATDVHEEPWGNNKIQRGGTQQAGHKQEQSKPEDEVVHVKISSFQEPCASLHLSALSQRLLAQGELEDRPSQRNKVLPRSCLAMPCCCRAEGLPVPLLSQIQQGMGAVICSPPRGCISQISAYVDLLPTMPLSAPAL